jgi:hypothetical protein
MSCGHDISCVGQRVSEGSGGSVKLRALRAWGASVRNEAPKVRRLASKVWRVKPTSRAPASDGGPLRRGPASRQYRARPRPGNADRARHLLSGASQGAGCRGSAGKIQMFQSDMIHRPKESAPHICLVQSSLGRALFSGRRPQGAAAPEAGRARSPLSWDARADSASVVCFDSFPGFGDRGITWNSDGAGEVRVIARGGSRAAGGEAPLPHP